MQQIELMPVSEIPAIKLESIATVMNWNSEHDAFRYMYNEIYKNRGVSDVTIVEECGMKGANFSKVKTQDNHGLHGDPRWRFQNLTGSLGLEQYQLHKLGHRPISYLDYTSMVQKIESLEEEVKALKDERDGYKRMFV